MGKVRQFLNDNALMVAGMLLMLASAGVDGAFLSMWMSPGLGWLGYVLNLVADATSYVLSNSYGRLQGDEDEAKRKLSRLLLVGEWVNIFYSWLFSYIVLRDRFVTFFTRSITGNLASDIEWLAFISAGFVPLTLVFLGYADSLNKTQPVKRARGARMSSGEITPLAAALPKVAASADALAEANAARVASAANAVALLKEFYAMHPDATQAEAAQAAGKSRQWVTARLKKLEATGEIRRNGVVEVA